MKLKSYRGRYVIECAAKTCIESLLDNMRPECMSCQHGVTRSIDLEGKILYEHKYNKAKKKEKKK